MDKKFIEKMEKRLISEKRRLEEEIGRLRRPAGLGDNPDMADRAMDSERDATNESLARTHEFLLEKIERALERISRGAYGKCANCDKEMREDDLEKSPWSEYCQHCPG